MSVLIKGMDMPRNCKECDYLYGSLREGYRCRRLEKWLDVAVDAKRDPDCPVVAVPTPHGDLIDRSKIHYCHYDLPNYNGSFYAAEDDWINEMTPIIEAEE